MRKTKRQTKTSKFVGKEFDNGWVCTGINVATRYGQTKRHTSYWYAFERRTSDGKCDKWIRVEASAATKIYKGVLKVEDVCNIYETKNVGMHKVNYNFK